MNSVVDHRFISAGCLAEREPACSYFVLSQDNALSRLKAGALVAKGGVILPERLAAALMLPLEDMARLAQLSPDVLRRDAGSAHAQAKLGEVVEILRRATDITGDTYRAVIWFKFDRLDRLGDKTPAEIVEDGRADAVSAYLHLIENGVYS